MFQAETNQSRRQLRLLTNHSTSELIPKDRKQKLKAKRQQLMRKLNRVADQIYNLKYDTEYEFQQLHQLRKLGDEIFEKVAMKREEIRGNLEGEKENQMEEDIVPALKLDKIEENTTDNSQKSTSEVKQVQECGLKVEKTVQEIQTERAPLKKQSPLRNSAILRRNSIPTALRTTRPSEPIIPSKTTKQQHKIRVFPLTEFLILTLGLFLIYTLI